MQAADTNHMDPQQVPLTGYENYHQEFQMYPAAREPVMVQLTVSTNNTNTSALLDLPNINTNLPLPLTPQQAASAMSQPTQEVVDRPVAMNSSSEILESIQSIAKVMQQQLLFSSKTAMQGIIQNTMLFQEMIKAQFKRDLDPALLTIPTFTGEPADRPQCLEWVSRVKNVCEQSSHSFRLELINKSGILVQNFIRSLNVQLTNKDLKDSTILF